MANPMPIEPFELFQTMREIAARLDHQPHAVQFLRDGFYSNLVDTAQRTIRQRLDEWNRVAAGGEEQRSDGGELSNPTSSSPPPSDTQQAHDSASVSSGSLRGQTSVTVTEREKRAKTDERAKQRRSPSPTLSPSPKRQKVDSAVVLSSASKARKTRVRAGDSQLNAASAAAAMDSAPKRGKSVRKAAEPAASQAAATMFTSSAEEAAGLGETVDSESDASAMDCANKLLKTIEFGLDGTNQSRKGPVKRREHKARRSGSTCLAEKVRLPTAATAASQAAATPEPGDHADDNKPGPESEAQIEALRRSRRHFDNDSLKHAACLHKSLSKNQYRALVPRPTHCWVENPLNPVFATLWLMPDEHKISSFEERWSLFFFKGEIPENPTVIEDIENLATALTDFFDEGHKLEYSWNVVFTQATDLLANMVVAAWCSPVSDSVTLIRLNGSTIECTHQDAKGLLVVMKALQSQ